MNKQQTATLLTIAAAYDRRTIGDADVIAWADGLSDLSFDDAAETVKLYYREHDDQITVAKVRSGVTAIRRNREEAEAKNALRRGGRDPRRHCGREDCQCTHTHCANGILDELVEHTAPEGHPFAGDTYLKSTWCLQCHPEKSRPVMPTQERRQDDLRLL